MACKIAVEKQYNFFKIHLFTQNLLDFYLYWPIYRSVAMTFIYLADNKSQYLLKKITINYYKMFNIKILIKY